ncbi:MAG TPA: TPM domain-containing protein [Patescibacteria group bacterium]|jgi:uncharacterized protein|nr:TPM domain-containing protein [Patescibacteria group bacterium]
MIYYCALLILFSLFTFKNNGQEPIIPLISQYNSFFIDNTGTLNQSFISSLNQQAKDFENTGFQIAGFFAATTERSTVDVATEFGNKNGIGFKDKDNGIAIAIFLEKQNNAGKKPTIGVAIGKGLEGLLNDAKIGRLLDETFVKKRAVGQWQEGLVDFIQKTGRYLKDPKAQEFAYLQKRKGLPDNIKGFFLILLMIVLILWFNSKNNRKGPRKQGPNGPFFIHPGSGFRGGGFSGGGGGGFGGGGAGR